jgi:drug/metabolite transporter (DMT)-like permease
MLGIWLALGSNISFASASIFFTKYGEKWGAVKMNYFKALVAFACFSVVNLVLGNSFDLAHNSWWLLVASGLIGLTIGDIFLIRAFTHLGAGRTLMIFGFSPLILAIMGYFFFGETLKQTQMLAILFLILCLLAFAWEQKKSQGHWGVVGISLALGGVFLDACGLVLTKNAMIHSPEMSVFEVNFIRSGVTVLAFFSWSLMKRKGLEIKKSFFHLAQKERIEIVAASFFGTVLSLSFYMKAIEIGPLATVSAVAGTSPLFATLFEIIRGRRSPTVSLFFAVICFICGVSLLIFF